VKNSIAHTKFICMNMTKTRRKIEILSNGLSLDQEFCISQVSRFSTKVII
jgi:hypothetical protein